MPITLEVFDGPHEFKTGDSVKMNRSADSKLDKLEVEGTLTVIDHRDKTIAVEFLNHEEKMLHHYRITYTFGGFKKFLVGY